MPEDIEDTGYEIEKLRVSRPFRLLTIKSCAPCFLPYDDKIERHLGSRQPRDWFSYDTLLVMPLCLLHLFLLAFQSNWAVMNSKFNGINWALMDSKWRDSKVKLASSSLYCCGDRNSTAVEVLCRILRTIIAVKNVYTIIIVHYLQIVPEMVKWRWHVVVSQYPMILLLCDQKKQNVQGRDLFSSKSKMSKPQVRGRGNWYIL